MNRSLITLLYCWICFTATSQTLNLDSLDNAIKTQQRALIGKPFFFLELTTLTGELITPAILKGKIVVYNLWFTACSPCVAEIPALNKLKASYREGVEFIGLTFNFKEDLTRFLKANPFEFKIVSIPRRDLESKISFAYPTTVIVNKKGKIIYLESGGSVDPTKADAAIQETVKPVIDRALSE